MLLCPSLFCLKISRNDLYHIKDFLFEHYNLSFTTVLVSVLLFHTRANVSLCTGILRASKSWRSKVHLLSLHLAILTILRKYLSWNWSITCKTYIACKMWQASNMSGKMGWGGDMINWWSSPTYTWKVIIAIGSITYVEWYFAKHWQLQSW